MNMKNKRTLILVISFVMVSAFCFGGSRKNALSLWTDKAPAKKALIEYVDSVTNKKSADFIPIENRIAIFDFDGTLFLETDPTYFDWMLFEHRVLDDKSFTPSAEQLEAAKLSREQKKFPGLSASRERMVSEAYKDLTLDDFYAYVRAFMKEDQPGFTNLKRGDAWYKPMVQVVSFLIENNFTVYVSSGTDRLTVRPLVMDTLPLPAKQIIGSDSTIVTEMQGDKDGLEYTYTQADQLVLGGRNLVKNLQMNKVSSIVREIGLKPVLAFGNSSTDASMLNYSIQNNKYKALAFMLCCDDLEREYGNLKKADSMKEASAQNGWIPVSMKDDWKTIYGEDVKRK